MGFSVRVFAVLVVGVLGVSVGSEKPAVVKIGALFSFDSVIGKGAKLAMEMAVKDINSDPSVLDGTELELIMEDLGCNVIVGSVKALQVIGKEVVAIVGPQSSDVARVISDIASEYEIPVVSYAATNPVLSSLQFPYFLRTAPPDSNQMAAAADIVDFYGWKEIVAVFVDNDYGRNGVNALSQELVKRTLRISFKLPLSSNYNLSEISDILNRSKSFGPRVYVVHIDPDPQLRFFRVAKKLDMITSNYVWLATDWLSSTLDSLPGDRNFVNVLQGIVMLRPHFPSSVPRKAFNSQWRIMQQRYSSFSNITAYGLYAYDSIWLVAHSIDRFLKQHGLVTFSSTNKFVKFGNHKAFDNGEHLLQIMLESSFTGLTGLVQLDSGHTRMSVDYEIVNVVQGKTHTVGHWLNQNSLSAQRPESLKKNKSTSSLQSHQLHSITWPGGKVDKPRGYVISTIEKPLRIGFPRRVGFSDFVTDMNDSHRVRGYCIDLFEELLKLIPYEVPFRYEPFGDGLKNPNYDDFVRMVADDVFDVAIGDIAIVVNRMKNVDFTQPFTATGLVIVAPFASSTSSGWMFTKPFTLEMWCAIAASFLVIAVIIWLLEHHVNNDFRGPPRRQLATMFLFSFSTLFKKSSETIVSTLGRIVMVVWLFLLLVITSSYTASLSSILTVEQLSTCIEGLEDLILSKDPIGYQVGSFSYRYMTESLGIHPSRLISLGSPEEFEAALRRGPSNGGVAAIVDETPYIELFLSQQTDFKIIGQPFTKSGWGFAFQKGSPLAVDMSTAILKFAENGKLMKLHKKWFCKKDCPDERTEKSNANKLQLSSFWALYSVCGTFALIALFVFLTRALRQYMRYRRQQCDTPPSACSQAIHNFLDFFDKKEEAIKKICTHHDKNPTQVCK